MQKIKQGVIIVAQRQAVSRDYMLGGATMLDHAVDFAMDCGFSAIVVIAPIPHGDPAKGVVYLDISSDKCLLEALQIFGEEIDNVLLMSAHTPLLKYGSILQIITMLGSASVDGAVTAAVALIPEESGEDTAKQITGAVTMVSHTKILENIIRELIDSRGMLDMPTILSTAISKGLGVLCISAPISEIIVVNSKSALAIAEYHHQCRKREKLLHDGVTLMAPETVFIGYRNKIECGAVIHPHVVLGPNVSIEAGAEIKSFSCISDATIMNGAIVGPFANISSGSVIGYEAVIGNFVEVKRSKIGRRVKAKHLSYLGDATIGHGSNIGAGVITCNYKGPGKGKAKTTISERCFIGANVSLIAPLTVGDNAYIAAGSVITDDVPDKTMAISRIKQRNKIKP